MHGCVREGDLPPLARVDIGGKGGWLAYIFVFLEDYATTGGRGGVGLIKSDGITEGFHLFGAGVVGEGGGSIKEGLFEGQRTVSIFFGLVESIEGGFFFLIIPFRLSFFSLDEVDPDWTIGMDDIGLDFKLGYVHNGGLELLFGGPALLFRGIRELAGGGFALEGFFSGGETGLAL